MSYYYPQTVEKVMNYFEKGEIGNLNHSMKMNHLGMAENLMMSQTMGNLKRMKVKGVNQMRMMAVNLMKNPKRMNLKVANWMIDHP